MSHSVTSGNTPSWWCSGRLSGLWVLTLLNSHPQSLVVSLSQFLLANFDYSCHRLFFWTVHPHATHTQKCLTSQLLLNPQLSLASTRNSPVERLAFFHGLLWLEPKLQSLLQMLHKTMWIFKSPWNSCSTPLWIPPTRLLLFSFFIEMQPTMHTNYSRRF